MEIFSCTGWLQQPLTQQLLCSLPPQHCNTVALQHSIAIAKLEAVRTEACQVCSAWTFLDLPVACRCLWLICSTLAYLCVVQAWFYTDSCNEQLFCVEWNIYNFNTMMLCREIQACYNSRDLEKWRGRMQHRRVQVWDDKRWGTGVPTAINHSPAGKAMEAWSWTTLVLTVTKRRKQ